MQVPGLPASLRLFASAVLLGALMVVGGRGAGSLPPLGSLLEPAQGVWALARSAEFPPRSHARIPGLDAPVTVLYDDRGVPHIFAASEPDAWRAQGYVVARDRLFQMELQSRAASGTLSELVGARARAADLATRRRGFPWAAERNFTALDSASLIFRAASAYAEGVNARIAELTRADLPLEYRLLGARPVPWRPLNTYYLFLQMSYTLAWSDPTLMKDQARALVGAAAAEALFPRNSPIQEPIQPNGRGAPRYDFRPLPPPGPPEPPGVAAVLDGPRRTEAIGSNNWAVAPGRTARGAALLAGDPHLELSLPSIWYELHLHVEGGTDVAGVTFAGSPGVIIGFNRDLAWSFTNTGADVRDLYLERVDSPERPMHYWLDGAWQPLELREEIVRDRQGKVLAVDTVRFTHRGPLVAVPDPLRGGADRWMSIRWTVWDARSTGEEFLRLDRARSVAEWLDGWKDFQAPAQNGIVADRSGTIAIRSTGRYPIRPGDGRGDLIRDGQTRAADWIGNLPLERYPFAINPAQGFLASNNQQPVDPVVNPAYFGADWYSPWRALRINRLLRADSAVSPDAMRRYQTDPGSERAAAFLPYLIAAGERSPDSVVARATALLRRWEGRYTRDSETAGLFEAVMRRLARGVWDELIPPRAPGDSVPPAEPAVVPEDAVLLELMADSQSVWWDDRRTPTVERRDAILAEAVRAGYDDMVRAFGPPGPAWRWDRVHHANIWHLLRLPGLSALDLGVSGGPSTLSPSPGGGTHGASWRMVAELGPRVTAAGIYPGGQSGNPASARYLDRLAKWLDGTLDSILFPRRPEEIPAARLRSTLHLTPPGP